MDLQLRGKRVLITGGSSGIGAATAVAFAEEGCRLWLVARNAQRLAAQATALRRRYRVDVAVHSIDLRRADGVTKLTELSPDIDILVNNAGDIPGGDLQQVDEATWRRGWDLKVFGYINLARTVYKSMEAKRSGVIVNIIGLAGERFDFNYIAGTAGNAALMAFTRALGSQSLSDGIRVLGVNPGPVGTSRIIGLMKARAAARYGDEARYPELLADLPLGRPATPEEVADTAVFLSSGRSSYTSGVIVTVDGGQGARIT